MKKYIYKWHKGYSTEKEYMIYAVDFESARVQAQEIKDRNYQKAIEEIKAWQEYLELDNDST